MLATTLAYNCGRTPIHIFKRCYWLSYVEVVTIFLDLVEKTEHYEALVKCVTQLDGHVFYLASGSEDEEPISAYVRDHHVFKMLETKKAFLKASLYSNGCYGKLYDWENSMRDGEDRLEEIFNVFESVFFLMRGYIDKLDTVSFLSERLNIFVTNPASATDFGLDRDSRGFGRKNSVLMEFIKSKRQCDKEESREFAGALLCPVCNGSGRRFGFSCGACNGKKKSLERTTSTGCLSRTEALQPNS